MTIKKGISLDFSQPIIVSIMVDEKSQEGFDFNEVISVFREEDNTVILTRSDGSKVLIPGNKYIFLEIKGN
ncbi:MAG: hypothetical protein QXL01_07810 [Thermoplasmatales archaeon]